MAASVIDSLVVELGLDPRKFTEGQRAALQSLRDMENAAASSAGRIEEYGTKISDVFSTVKKGAVGVLGAFVGEQAVAFVANVAAGDAAVSRLSKTLGVNIESLSTWQGMVRQMGGAATDATATLGALTDAMSRVQAGGGAFDGTFATLLNRSGDFRGKTADQVLRQISKYLEDEQKAGRMSPAIARMFAESIPGINESMMNLILRGPAALDAFAEAARKAGIANKEAGDEAEEFQKKEAELTSSLENLARYVFPALTGAVNTLLIPLKVISALFSGDLYKATDKSNGITNDQGFWHDVGKIFGWLGGSLSQSSISIGGGAGIPIKPGAGTASPAVQGILAALAGTPGLKQVTAMNDAYHVGLGGGHPAGRAVDVTINDPSQSAAMVATIRARLAAQGISASVIDEYLNPSAHATGGHIHIGVPTSIMSGGARHAIDRAGGGAGAHQTNHTDIHATINLSSPHANPRDVAMEIPDALHRITMAIPADNALV